MGLIINQPYDIIKSEREENKMKITIKNQEYKLLHNIPKGERFRYNNEECIKTEKSNMIVGINTGNIYTLSSNEKIYMNTERERVLVESLSIGDFFIYNGQLYVVIFQDGLTEVFNLNTLEGDFLDDIEVELIQDKNIQIKVK